ncbi:MAG: hypothetical protein ACUZ8O_13485 [Candidatus Anammoxibacter sp.]
MKPESLLVAKGTIGRFTERISLLYQQGAGIDRIGEYVKHWFKWVRTGVRGVEFVDTMDTNEKRQHSPSNGECWRHVNINISVIPLCYLAHVSLFILPSFSVSGAY